MPLQDSKLKLAASPPWPRPGQTSRALVRAVEAGDLDSAAARFSREGCFLTRDGTAVNGRDQIRGVLAQLIARRPRFHVAPNSMLALGDLVLANERWRMEFQAEGAKRREESTSPTLLLRRVESGWKLAMLAPWGWN
jgi:uncharacterized protein (TIGR02246 family)